VAQERQFEGDETWLTLQNWLKGQKASERLAGSILQSEGYLEVDPSHPLGGQDGGKDILCEKDGMSFVGAVYFPRGQQGFADIKKKFTDDLEGVAKNKARGFVFVTNQELRLAERRALENVDPNRVVELYHLERLTLLLNVPKNYGVRLEYLGIRITEDEHLAFLAARDQEHYRRLQEIESRLDKVVDKIEQQAKDLVGYATGGDSLAFFTPSIRAGTDVVELYLFNDSKYPIFDICGYYVNLDDQQVESDVANFELPLVHTPFQFGTLHAGKAIVPALRFDMSNRTRLAINLFLHTRTRFLMQFFRFFKKAQEITIAYKTQDLKAVIDRKVPVTIPGYNPEDPDAVFK
jgi:hypothetical protein